MTNAPDTVDREGDERFLVLAPTGRDGSLTCALLQRAGIDSRACADMSELCQRVEQEGAAGLLIAEEVLVLTAFQQLCQLLLRQEAWSDIPIVLFTGEKVNVDARPPTAQLLAPLGNVSLLDRPLRPITMVSAARAGLRARHRQYAARSELKRQQRAVEQRDQFLAMLGHELRNPLSAILMAASAMCDGGSASKPKYLEILRRQAGNLARLVDDLLDVSRVTSGRIVLQSVQLEVGELLRRCLQVTGAAAVAQKVEVELSTPAGKLVVEGDPVRLEQVFVNLIGNAVKYTPSGGHVEVRVERDEGHVLVKIRDDGVGIAADMLPRIFDMFVQAEGSLDRAKGGLGIGLTLVRSLVQLHHGSVTATSPGEGRGSEFCVRLPLHVVSVSDEESDKGAAARANEPGPQRPTYDILIVEDNVDSREILQIILERDGHRVDAVGDGLSGVERALARRPELMVVDLGLPGLDGFGVARRVREALGRDVYLIALTGYGQPEDRRRALEAGFDAHLTKPIDIDAISGMLAVARK